MAASAEKQQWAALSDEFASVIEKLGASIVAVHGRRRLGASGIHWSSGLIVTANHMIRRDAELSITLPDRSSAPATLVGRDPSTDVAVVKSDKVAGELAPVETTSTAGLKVGHTVIAIGRSHLGDIAASTGIVARLGSGWKTWRGGQIDQLVRPDLRLYLGQSGSALVNWRSQVLGMNTTALARMSAITVPATTIDRVIAELLEYGHIRRPYLGMAMQMVTISGEVGNKLNLEQDTGLLVAHLETEGPGAKAGVMLGDITTGIGGKPAGDLRTLQDALSGLRVGDVADLNIIRAEEKKTLKITIGDRAARK